MDDQCIASTRNGKRCKRKALLNEEYCRGHLYLKSGKIPFYKKPSFYVITTTLTILAIVIGLLGIHYTRKGPTKKEMQTITSEAFQTKLEELGISTPKTYEEIRKAIGKTCVQVGQVVGIKL